MLAWYNEYMKKTKTCSFEGCNRKHYGNGLCEPHNHQRIRGRDLTPIKSRYIVRGTTEEIISAKTILTSTGCLEWTGYVLGGYGSLKIDGKDQLVHRVVWHNTHGEIPKGKVIDHKCYNRLCANIDHLHLVTYKENSENRSVVKSNTGYLGVHKAKDGSYQASVGFGEFRHRKRFSSLEDANKWVVAKRNEIYTNNLKDRVDTN